jgi:hypothetical protein
MFYRNAIGAVALTAAWLGAVGGADAFDESKYPNLKGQWDRTTAPRFDPTARLGETAPLTAEYKAIHEANLADQAAGGHGTEPTHTCLSPGMPRAMNVYEPMEILVTPQTTYILIDHIHDSRRIHTDGRGWPAEIEPTFAGLSIGQWIDEDGDGKYDALVAETRGFKGPRAYDASGLLLHRDNQSIIKERIYLDKSNPNILVDEITVIDNALTRPWSVTKKYKRDPKDTQPTWREVVCAENNNHVVIGKDNYFVSADGYLMPARKDQSPPDLKYFNQLAK